MFYTGNIFAQDVTEAFNIANQSVQGTARSIGFGSTLGAVGGDFSSISVNPAGIGIYRSSELSFTPSLKINSSSSTYLSNATDDFNVRVNLNNFGVVFTSAPGGKRYERHAFKAFSFAMGMNRVADFNRDYNYNGINKSNSASQVFESDANADTLNRYINGTPAYIGYQTGLIDGYAGHYLSILPISGGIRQTNSISERGGINEFLMALGGNYREKLMMGITFGIPSVSYRRTSNYTEQLGPGNTGGADGFQSFTYNNVMDVTGLGFNVKLGAIYKLTDYFRVGAAFHTPTFYSLSSVNDYGISTLINGRQTGLSTANYLPQRIFDYGLVTPYKGVLSAALVLKRMGFITGEIEVVNYKSMRYDFGGGIDEQTGYSYSYEAGLINRDIRSNYQSVVNMRAGAEIKLTRYLMIRGGLGYYGNAYINPIYSSERFDFSGGIGFRTRHFFADFGMVHSEFTTAEQPYNGIDFGNVRSAAPSVIPVASTSNYWNNIAFTVGCKF